MTSRIGSKGQVVIPKPIRERSGMHPGTEVEFTLEGERLVVVPRRSPASLGGRFHESGMASRLLDDRVREPR